MKFHPLVTTIERPSQLNDPFCYDPHPLCRLAAAEVQQYIPSVKVWQREICHGKMFGVLVVENEQGELGFLAAHSGLLAGKSNWDYFVPSVFEFNKWGGYYRSRELEISYMSKNIDELTHYGERPQLIQDIKKMGIAAAKAVEAHKAQMRQAKIERDELREMDEDCDEDELIRESQSMKSELHRIKKYYQEQLDVMEADLAELDNHILELKRQRKAKSDELQQWVFDNFEVLNSRGEKRNLTTIFDQAEGKQPPSGAGDCCAPKLFQYAFTNNLRPLCVAEFWWGISPKGETRRHGQYYPACRGKCLPILAYMLGPLGLPSLGKEFMDTAIDPIVNIEYEDENIAVVRKPAGLLSVPGKELRTSVYTLMRERYPDAESPLIVHRLDMATSGLLVIAKTKQAHHHLQMQFRNREVKKRYIALLDSPIKGRLEQRTGTISLPLCPDPYDRPRQVVDEVNGKTAITDYEVLGQEGALTRVALYPRTGRTHQLRVHCAHQGGLDAPIKGDELYGNRSSRLYLHAEYLEITHPQTGERMAFEWKTEF